MHTNTSIPALLCWKWKKGKLIFLSKMTRETETLRLFVSFPTCFSPASKVADSGERAGARYFFILSLPTPLY
jgi:hypothetical protein